MSLPTGLSCTFVPETYAGIAPQFDNQSHHLLVKQSYSTKCNEKATEHFKNYNPHVLKEKSRLIKADGTVIKFMNDNTIEMYYANGTIYRKQIEIVPPEIDPLAESQEAEQAKDKSKRNSL